VVFFVANSEDGDGCKVLLGSLITGSADNVGAGMVPAASQIDCGRPAVGGEASGVWLLSALIHGFQYWAVKVSPARPQAARCAALEDLKGCEGRYARWSWDGTPQEEQ
jgi:hypothetical protein